MPKKHPLGVITARPRAVIYTRVSKDMREGRSVAEQEADCRGDVDRHDWDLVAVLSDSNVSASRYAKAERPDWLKLMAMLRRHELDIAVFWEMSRGTRNRIEWAEFAELAIDRGLLICVRGRVYDATDPHDMAYLDNLVARGIEESGESRERVVRTITSQAEKGQPHGPPCYGYRSVYDPKTGNLLTREPDTTPLGESGETPASLVRKGSADLLTGRKVPYRVAADWNLGGHTTRGGGQWTASTVIELYRRPALMGKREWRGKIIDEGGWEPLIEPADWWELQEVLAPKPAAPGKNPRGRPRGSTNREADAKYLCVGTTSCGVCGAGISSGMNRTVLSYRCAGGAPGQRRGCVARAVHILDAHVEALVVAEMSAPGVLDRLQTPQPDPKATAEARGELAELRTELEEARDAATTPGPGRLPVSMLLRLEETLGARITELEEQLKPPPGLPRLVEEIAVPDPVAALGVWRGWTLTQQRRLLREVFTVRVLPIGRVGSLRVAPSESVELRLREKKKKQKKE